MSRFIGKIIGYFIVFWLFSLMFERLSGEMGYFLLAGLILALINTLIRPFLQALTIPFHLITLGITGIFVNMFTLWMVFKIVGPIHMEGFWLYSLIALMVILLDTIMRRSKKIAMA